MDSRHLLAPAMTPEKFIEALYNICLRRSADDAGKAHWIEVIRSTGDPTRVLEGVLNSEEYLKQVQPDVSTVRLKSHVR